MPEIIDCFRGENFVYSNFYGIPVVYKDHVYKSSEHAFHAQKATNEKDRQYIEDAPTPGIAKRRGREIKCRADWNDIRVDEMASIVYAKFSRNSHLHDKLCSTGDSLIIEGNAHGDTFWGMVKDSKGEWVGKNNLGKILMIVRGVFLTSQKITDHIL